MVCEWQRKSPFPLDCERHRILQELYLCRGGVAACGRNAHCARRGTQLRSRPGNSSFARATSVVCFHLPRITFVVLRVLDLQKSKSQVASAQQVFAS